MPACEQRPEQTHAVLACQPVVVVHAGDHDAHVDAAALGIDERVDRRLDRE